MFYCLRKHRRLVGTVVLAALTVWLSAVLASCMAAPVQPMSEPMVAAADMRSDSTKASDMGDCPGGVCATMQSAREIVADHDVASTTFKLLLATGLLTIALFSLNSSRRDGPRPPDPLLPKRSPFLRFYALRI